MAIITKKITPEYFELIKSGKKKFELRLAEFEVKEGDLLVLEEFDMDKKEYTGRKIEKYINYVLKFNLDIFGQKKEILEKGLYVLQFE
jgi:ASC-1-like (ASCH) protein